MFVTSQLFILHTNFYKVLLKKNPKTKHKRQCNVPTLDLKKD